MEGGVGAILRWWKQAAGSGGTRGGGCLDSVGGVPDGSVSLAEKRDGDR